MLGPRKLRYQRFKEWLLNRVYRRKSSAKDRLVDRTTSIDQSTSSNFIVDVTDSQTMMTDVDGDTTSRQGVSTRHASIRIGPSKKLPSIEESETIQPNKTVINSVNEFTFSTRKTRSVLLTTVPIDLASFKYFPS